MEQKQRQEMRSLYKGFIEGLIGEKIELKDDDICPGCKFNPCDYRQACDRDDKHTGSTTTTSWCGTYLNAIEEVDCVNLVPAKEDVPRPHCECNGMEGDCYIYLGKSSTCRFRVKRETKS